jgi:hypothetical protein
LIERLFRTEEVDDPSADAAARAAEAGPDPRQSNRIDHVNHHLVCNRLIWSEFR